MQQYKSTLNTELDAKNSKRAETRKGEIPFALDNNISGRIEYKFTKEYQIVPIVLTSVVVTEGSEFDVKCVLTSVTTDGFTVNVQNSSSSDVKGIVQWTLA